MTKEEYVSEQHKLIDNAFSSKFNYTLVFCHENKEEDVKCSKCQNYNFYSFNNLIICSNCFTEYTCSYDNYFKIKKV